MTTPSAHSLPPNDAVPAAAEFRELNGLPVLSWPIFDEHDLDAFVTTRAGGVSTGGYAELNLGLMVQDD